MKKYSLIALLILVATAWASAQQYDDVYFDPDTDYDDSYQSVITDSDDGSDYDSDSYDDNSYDNDSY